MISKNRIKTIHSLEIKKNRIEQNLFIAEGPKLIEELLKIYTPKYIASLDSWFKDNRSSLHSSVVIDIVTEEELKKTSLLQHPQKVIALFEIPHWYQKSNLDAIAKHELVLALDGVQDPGNLGTIVRVADWFGIKHIFCSPDTVDIFNPKAIQATMGAIAHVEVHYVDLEKELSLSTAPIYGTHLDGDNLYTQKLANNGVIVMGNEGRGVSKEIGSMVTQRLYIPPYPSNSDKVESLNVAIATSVVCAEFRRRCM